MVTSTTTSDRKHPDYVCTYVRVPCNNIWSCYYMRYLTTLFQLLYSCRVQYDEMNMNCGYVQASEDRAWHGWKCNTGIHLERLRKPTNKLWDSHWAAIRTMYLHQYKSRMLHYTYMTDRLFVLISGHYVLGRFVYVLFCLVQASVLLGLQEWGGNTELPFPKLICEGWRSRWTPCSLAHMRGGG